MSDRRLWLEEWCSRCSAAPGRCCRVDFGAKRRGPAPWRHIARGHRERRCPTCKAYPGEPCRTPSGREASGPHEARLRAGAGGLVGRDQVWAQLGRLLCAGRGGAVLGAQRARRPSREHHAVVTGRCAACGEAAVGRGRARIRARRAGVGSVRGVRRPSRDPRGHLVDSRGSPAPDLRGAAAPTVRGDRRVIPPCGLRPARRQHRLARGPPGAINAKDRGATRSSRT